MTSHPDPTTLHDLVDGRLDSAAADALGLHLGECPDCARRVARLRALVAEAAAAPRAVEPARDLWPEIRARLSVPRVVPLHGIPEAPVRRGLPPLARRRVVLLAAGLAIAVVSSAITALVFNRRAGADRVASAEHERGAPPAATEPAPGARRPDSRGLDVEYARAAAELSATWRASGARLTPSTAAALDSSLRAVDAAIEEVRRASAAAPDDPLMTELLAAAWRRKIDLLRRALELPART